MISVIRKSVVARSLQRLREQKTHPLFAGYLHLQQRAAELHRLDDLQPDFISYFQQYFLVKDHPIGAPYIRPFTTKVSAKNLWLNENVAGSYAPSSLRPGQPFRLVVHITPSGGYSLAPDHAESALKYLLYNKSVSVADLVVFLYRDFGILDSAATIDHLILAFANSFGYIDYPRGVPSASFSALFDNRAVAEWPKDWLEPLPNSAELPAPKTGSITLPSVTKEHVRNLSAEDLLLSPAQIEGSQTGPPLRQLRIKGLLSFRDETVFEFGRLNLLVGPNGSGKSNLIDCLRVFRESSVDIQTRFAREGFDSWLNNNLDKEREQGQLVLDVYAFQLPELIRHTIRFGPINSAGAPLEEGVASIPLDPNLQPTSLFAGSYRTEAKLSIAGAMSRRRRKRITFKDYNPFQSILSQVRDIGLYPELTRLANLYSKIRIYSEWSFGRDSQLRKPASPTRSDSQLSEQMADLPSCLNILQQTPAHEKIKRLLPELKKTYRDYVTRVVWGHVGLELVEVPFDKLPVPASRLSDGTLRFLALATILLRSDPPPVICLEEPELGMHPDMIRMVADMIIEASLSAQLIVSTHSVDLLTALQDNFDVLFAFDSRPNGSFVQRLTREEYCKWRAEHNLGDLWSSGELGGVRY